MNIVNNVKDVREIVQAWKGQGLSVGLVPTMGYLHEGHMSLVKRAKENDRVVVSIFVNPMQFGINEDLGSYPRDIESDIKLCETNGVDLIFNPDAEEMYSKDFYTYINMSLLTETLCGSSRPGHFKGVCTVVAKLFNIVLPDSAYFGEKDAQQLAIIKKMASDLNFDIDVIGCPIIREDNGLAKSSRNKYLNEEERKASLVLNRSIQLGQKMIAAGEKNTDIITEAMKKLIEAEPLARIDYLKAVDAVTMQEVPEIEGATLFAMAVFIGKTRLIDNFINRNA